MKKGLGVFGVASLSLLVLAGCGPKNNGGNSVIKVGLITLHGETSTYDKNFIDAFNKAATKAGVKPTIISGVEETDAVTTAATTLYNDGNKFIFADSFAHESYLSAFAKTHKDVEFGHASGITAHTEKLDNFTNAFANIYEGRYLAGVAAGLKLQAMIAENPTTAHKVGYVGAYPYAEVISGYTSWYLGVKSIVDDVTMSVRYTGSWYDETAEKNTATSLINDDHVAIVSQHADSMGAPSECQDKKVPNITYNGSTEASCPDTYVISSKINWEPYFEFAFNTVKAGKHLHDAMNSYDYFGELKDNIWEGDDAGSVALSTPGKKAAVAGTKEKLEQVAAQIRNNTLRVFDTANFTVDVKNATNAKLVASNGLAVDANNHLTTFNVEGKNVIKTEGEHTYFDESTLQSAPYFNVIIEGITING